MPDLIEKYDPLLKDDGPAAIIMKQRLMPGEGDGAVIFPPTYAAPKGDPDKRPRYNRDPFGSPEDNRYTVAIDSVGSQANRIEPLFKTEKYKHLVPQITVTHNDNAVNLLDAGHRIADAIVRFSELLPEIHNAFIEYQKGNPEPMARLAPTSLVFGAWDSRGTQVKIPRVITLRIDADNARILQRSAQYTPAIDYVAYGLIDEVDESTGSDLGFAGAPATGGLGGIQVFGEITRAGSLNLVTLQNLGLGTEPSLLQRYILGLSLVALTAFENSAFTLRQGCQLVARPDSPAKVHTVGGTGGLKNFQITATDALEFATETATRFKVPAKRSVAFDSALANRIRKLWAVKGTQEALKDLAKKKPLTMNELDAFEKRKQKNRKGKGIADSQEEGPKSEEAQ